ncbi:GntR family transcriptional regulator [Dactylosporangium sp. CA-052675]|uniref:GntR family transcriptional regulator n=1 Tax=Dactylosporangium sp. CA-052675 TaxID=3239927 RepID=UPI003D90423A
MTRFAADIVADLRRRILDGDLRPGEDLPSAKDIMAGWDATMATAYKAMTLLREEGLAAKHRGPGLIVTADAPTVAAAWQPPPAHGDVTRARIVSAAIELADADGLGNLSLRLIGQRAGGLVTGTFYKWVQDRAELELLMADAVFAKHPPPKPAGPWRAQLERLARLHWRLYRQHSWLALTVSFTHPDLAPAAHLAWAQRALAGRADAKPLAAALVNFVRGSAMSLEQQERKARRAEADADTELFEFGLEHLLDGFQQAAD